MERVTSFFGPTGTSIRFQLRLLLVPMCKVRMFKMAAAAMIRVCQGPTVPVAFALENHL